MKNTAKFIAKHCVCFLLHVFYILPINRRKLYFTAFNGSRFSCNPKYLYLYLKENVPDDFVYVWEFIVPQKNRIVKADKTVKPNSFKAVIEAMTSAFIITNNDFPWWIPLRKKQVLVQTWHGGGAYKKVGGKAGWGKIVNLEQKLNAKQISFYISSSQKFTDVMSVSKCVPSKKFLQCGMPRNSFLLNINESKKYEILEKFGLRSSSKILLYAPTYRGVPVWKSDDSTRNYGTLDFLMLKKICEETFGSSFVILYRAHHVDSNLKNALPDSVLDATRYEDMQELLCAADVLVTDYSSSMWDFALTKKPCFLYAPDLRQYIAERGFYTEPRSWPFPLAESEEELWKNISDFDSERYVAAVQKHLDDFGSYENKDACEKVCRAVGIKV